MGRDWDGLVMLKEGVQSKKLKLFILLQEGVHRGGNFRPKKM